MTTYELQVTYASKQAQGFKFIFYAFMKFRGFIASKVIIVGEHNEIAQSFFQ